MSGKDVYIRRLERLKSAQEMLLRLFAELDARFEPFRQLSEDYGSRIRKNGTKYIAWYVKRWLRCFIGMKDEVMVLISGEIIRKYHESGVHKEFIHDRGAENSIYRRSSILSLCSVDGIDYEYRMMVEKYGEKAALTRILDIHEPLGEKLNRLSKKIDDLVRIIHDAVQAFAPSKCQFDILHPAEKFLIIINDNPVINYKGARFRNCSQIDALSTVIDDPSDVISATVAIPRASTKRSRGAFNFEEDEEDEQALKLAKEAKKVPDFHMDISLDQIKRAAGVSADLLAKPTTADFLLREEADMDLTHDLDITEEDKSILSSSTETKQMLFHRFGLFGTNPNLYLLPNGIGLYSKRVLRFKIITDDTHVSSTGSVTASAGSSFHSNSLQAQQALERIVPIVVTAHDVLMDIKERGKLSPVLSASDLLDEITAFLWYGLSPDKDESVKHIPREERPHVSEFFHPFLPIALQMEGTIFIADEFVPLPVEDKPKKYPVTCDFCPAVTSLLLSLQQWILGPSDNPAVSSVLATERRKKQDILVANMSCIRYVAQKLRYLFQLVQQHPPEDMLNCHSTDMPAHLVELDSRKMHLSINTAHVTSMEDWYQWQAWIHDATTIIFESFSLYAGHCVYLCHTPSAIAATVTSVSLPFRFFPYVKCSSLSVSSLALPTDSHNRHWKLKSLDLAEDFALFEYLRFPYSEHVHRWRKILEISLPANAGEVDLLQKDAVISQFLDKTCKPENETIFPSGSIPSFYWKQLFSSLQLSSLSEEVRTLIELDPWIQFCQQLGCRSPHLQHIVLPYSLATSLPTSRFATLPWLTILVLFLGLAVYLEAKEGTAGGYEETMPFIHIHLPEQVLKILPSEWPTATEYLKSQFQSVKFVYIARDSSSKDITTAASLSIPIPDL